MVALSIPYLLLISLIIAVFFLLKKKWLLFILLLFLIFIINWWAECLPFRDCFRSNATLVRTFSVMSFNINSSADDIEEKVCGIIDIINKKNPDIVFLAEFPDVNLKVVDTLMSKRFKYTTCAKWYAHCFYSIYPLGEMTKINVGNVCEGIFKCNFFIGKDSITLYGCHFASNNYSADKQYFSPDSIKGGDDIKTYLLNIHTAYDMRSYEASLIVDDINQKVPLLVMGDMNDVGGSKAIKILENAGLKDAWWEGGFGYGATIHKPLPYRIDHIMYSEKLKLQKIEIISSEGLSDHDALYAEFSL